MINLSDEQFDQLITDVMDELPMEYIENMKNVSIVIADAPTPEQRIKLNLQCNQTLYGLYEGIPLTGRGAGYNLVLPDKITLFKEPMQASSSTLAQFREQLKRTLWHEIAHHYGLDHDRIHKLENSKHKHVE